MSGFFNWNADSETMATCLALVANHAAKYANLDVRRMCARPKKDGSERNVPRRIRPPISKEEISKMVAWEKSGKERKWIARELKTTESVVSRHLRGMGFVARVQSGAQARRERCVQLFIAGKSRQQIAEILGRSYAHVVEILRLAGHSKRRVRNEREAA